MKLKTACLLPLCVALSGPAFAGAYQAPPVEMMTGGWSVEASLGYTWYDDVYRNDGQTALGRFGIAKQVWSRDKFDVGLELGVQSGNRHRVNTPVDCIEAMGGLPVNLTVKPFIDLLATLKINTSDWMPSAMSTPSFGVVKLGVAWRRMQPDRVTVSTVNQAAFEVQAGLGMSIAANTDLNVSYQGIFSGSSRLSHDPATSTGWINNIQSQNGILIGVRKMMNT